MRDELAKAQVNLAVGKNTPMHPDMGYSLSIRVPGRRSAFSCAG